MLWLSLRYGWGNAAAVLGLALLPLLAVGSASGPFRAERPRDAVRMETAFAASPATPSNSDAGAGVPD